MQAIDKKILHLALPSIVQNITVPLLGLVDLTIVGHFGSAQAIAAIAVGSMIFNVLYWLLGFLRMGTSGLTAQGWGREDWDDVRRLLRRALLLGLGLGLALIALQIPLGWTALTVIHPSDSVRPLAHLYFSVCIWGAPAVLALYSLNGWFIGTQDTRTPLYVAIAQNIINIIASLVFVYLLRMNIAGVALGTLVAQWSGFALSVTMAHRKSTMLGKKSEMLHDAETSPAEAAGQPAGSPTPWSKFFTVNRDIFLRTVFLVAVSLFFTSVGAREGDVILSVNTVLFTFYTLVSYVLDGFAFAGEAVCGSTWGSGDTKAFRLSVSRLFHWGWIMAILFTIVYAVGGLPFTHLLTDEPNVRTALLPYFPWVILVPIMGMAAFVYDGVMIGITATRGMLVSSCLATVIFFALFFGLYALGLPTNHVLWGAFIVYLLARGVIQWRWMKRLY